ncbi:uncharacterized protein LOC121933000 [Sceloporus undulatus]|uniref:uncharacterized protein LOC121933000 n=1 Tax=Sceloporus undulatus TaxID=8520 RepID=UPI001C4AD98A|nr:uncharacterized protein LOC121933000 [Sceloporus undulatus]
MSWHKGLKNPIPSFNINLAETETGMQNRKRGPGAQPPPVTWGMIKNLSRQATDIVEKEGLEKTPENCTLALIASLNANSLCLITIFCLLMGVAGGQSVFAPGQNIWETLALSINQTSFCLSQQHSVGEALNTCLIPVCHSSQDIQNDTWFYTDLPANHSLRSLQYQYHNWGKQHKRLFPLAMHLQTPVIASHNATCARMTSCTDKSCVHLGSNHELKCSTQVHVPYIHQYVELPRGWFWTCSGHTFNYIPANLTDGTLCCLSRLTLLLPPRELGGENRRSKRSAGLHTLDESCDSSVKIMSPGEYLALGISIVGVPGLAVGSAKTIGKLACWAVKSLNTTSTAISLLNQEQSELRRGLLQNRAAIDYLLLLHHKECDEVPGLEGMCCFTITDNRQRIDRQLKTMKELAQSIRKSSLADWLLQKTMTTTEKQLVAGLFILNIKDIAEDDWSVL